MIYDQYINRIKSVVTESQNRKNIQKGLSSNIGYIKPTAKQRMHEQRLFTNSIHLNSPQPLNSILNPSALETATLGHPDFVSIKGTDETAFHYIVSVFIDIAGSTNLFRSYDLEEIYTITNTIQSAALHTCVSVGGHIQRLQGDGVFAYFGGKGIPKKKAVEMAVTACSMITYFVANDLKKMFLGDEIENIKTRIGIDFGDDDTVLWANFGVKDISELTTLSLHTSLASKMQAYANLNGIVVGENIKKLLQIDESVFDLVRNSKGELIRRYIFEDADNNFRYTQYSFDWYKFLKSLPNIKADTEGNLYIISNEDAEALRLEKLRGASSLITAGNAFTTATGNITVNNSGIQNQPHRFHHE